MAHQKCSNTIIIYFISNIRLYHH